MRNERIILTGVPIYERGLAMASPQMSKILMKKLVDKLEELLMHLYEAIKTLAQKGTKLIMAHFEVGMVKNEKRGKERMGWLPKAMPEKLMEAACLRISGRDEKLKSLRMIYMDTPVRERKQVKTCPQKSKERVMKLMEELEGIQQHLIKERIAQTHQGTRLIMTHYPVGEVLQKKREKEYMSWLFKTMSEKHRETASLGVNGRYEKLKSIIRLKKDPEFLNLHRIVD